MNTPDTFFLIGFAAGIAAAFLFDAVREHQRRKRRRIQHREAIRDRYY